MKKNPIHITNNSKAQISVEFEGNTTSPIYQQGAEYIQNALVVPNGSVRKRPGTRFVGLSLHGDKTRLKAFNGLMLASGYGFVTIYNGLNIATLDRSNLATDKQPQGTPPTPPTLENGVLKNVFASDVLVEYIDGTPVYAFPSKGGSIPTEERMYFVDRQDLVYDTYLHKSVEILPDTAVKPSSTIFISVPDATPPTDVTNVKYFPSQQPFSDKARVVIKVAISSDNLDEYFAGGGVLYGVTIDGVADKQSAESFAIGNIELNNIFKSEIKKDFRILQLKELTNNNLFENNSAGDAQYIITRTKDIGSTNTEQSFLDNINIDKLFLATFFQNRLVVAGSSVDDGAKVFFSELGNPTNFIIKTTNTIDTDPFSLTLSLITYPEITVLHEFGNNLVIGTPNAIYSIQNGGGGIAVNTKQPVAIIKISDIGVGKAKPFLYQDKLYLAQNGRQGIVELVKDPYSNDIQVKRILTFSDSILVNGYIKKIFVWTWDYQYIGALMSDGMVIKANLDDVNVNFNNWIFDKDTVLDVEPLVISGQEDVLYFAIQRAGVTLIEAMMNHQHVQKLEHSYSCVRKRPTEEESVNRYVSEVLPRYCRNGTYNDCAITLKAGLPQTGSISIASETAVLAGADDVLDVGDVLEVQGHVVHVISKINSSRYYVSNGGNISLSNIPLKDVRQKKKIWKNPMLKFMKGRGDLSINADGISFSIWSEDHIRDDGVMVLQEAVEWVTVGVMYRFALVSLPIVASYAAEGLMRRKLLGPVNVLFHFSYMIEVGVVMDKLDLRRFDPEEAIVWEQVNVYNGDEERNRLILKLDHPCPVEIVSFACEYGA